MLTRATVAGVAGAAGASTAEVVSVVTDGVAAAAVVPLGFVSVGAELLYTTALQIDLAFDLASIYGVPFDQDDVGEISTLLAMALGVDLIKEPSLHDKPATPGETKPWRVVRQMQRGDFAKKVSKQLLQQSILRNALPVVSVLVSATWHQIVLRRFARDVHTAMRQRLAIVSACRELDLAGLASARSILDGAWLIATADGDIGRREALALSTLIDSLALPDRIGVEDASFSDDEEDWFALLPSLPPPAHGVLMEVLALVASADGELDKPERRFLHRAARALRREVDLQRVERMVERLRKGDSLLPSAERLELVPQLQPS
jgi:tellurite resistance protein